jgi:hypothetical protein
LFVLQMTNLRLFAAAVQAGATQDAAVALPVAGQAAIVAAPTAGQDVVVAVAGQRELQCM